MKLIRVRYKETVHHRVSSHGGMDSEFSHTAIEEGVGHVLVNDKYEADLRQARQYFENSRWHDDKFEIISAEVVEDINIVAVLRPPITRL